jgi:hypothetical protein
MASTAVCAWPPSEPSADQSDQHADDAAPSGNRVLLMKRVLRGATSPGRPIASQAQAAISRVSMGI